MSAVRRQPGLVASVSGTRLEVFVDGRAARDTGIYDHTGQGPGRFVESGGAFRVLTVAPPAAGDAS